MKAKPIAVRFETSGELDEIVATGANVHLERMSRNHWWLMISSGTRSVHVNLLGRRRATIDAGVWDDSARKETTNARARKGHKRGSTGGRRG